MNVQNSSQFNRIAIVIQVNDKAPMFGFTYPTRAALKFMARRKLVSLKRQWRDDIVILAEAIIPLPQVAAV